MAEHPGKVVERMLAEREWSQVDLAEIIGKPRQLISDLVLGKRRVTIETADALADAFGTDITHWIQLQNTFDISESREKKGKSEIARKARLYSQYPIREMVKRGWINSPRTVDSLENELEEFFSRESFPFAARRRREGSKEGLQTAWLYRAYNVAKKLAVAPYSELGLARALQELKETCYCQEDIPRVSRILTRAGIRFVVIEALPSSLIDGVCFWINHQSPVIALSLRFDRIDYFWFTLIHELAHVKNNHGLDAAMLDVDLMERHDSVSVEERVADEYASNFLIPKAELDNFIARVYPLFTPAKITGFARRIGVHPGIVVGQLQYRNKLNYNQHRKMLVKVRTLITETAMYDGWNMVA